MPGIYRLSFTGLFNAQNGHRVTADLIRQTSKNVIDFLGRAAAEVEESGVFGRREHPHTLYSTYSTGHVMHRVFQKVRIKKK